MNQDEAEKTPSATELAGRLESRVMPTCETCAHWVMKDKGTEREFPYCLELRFWLPAVKDRIHTPSDFGCVKHSSLTGDTSNILP